MQSVYVRMNEEDLKRLDALVAEMSKRAHGVKVTRADALRVLVDRGHEAITKDKRKELKS